MKVTQNTERAMFNEVFPSNSIPFLNRIKELLEENGTNSLASIQGKELEKVKACLFVLITHTYGQLWKLDGLDEYKRLQKEIFEQ